MSRTGSIAGMWFRKDGSWHLIRSGFVIGGTGTAVSGCGHHVAVRSGFEVRSPRPGSGEPVCGSCDPPVLSLLPLEDS